MAMTEQEPNFGRVLEWSRALREQIDWDSVRAQTEASPFARAFFTLVEGLGIVESNSRDAGRTSPEPVEETGKLGAA